MSYESATGSTSSSEALIRPVMPELDTLRGVAVLWVVLLHGFYWQYSTLSVGALARKILVLTQPGWVGVNLFFVLSGFLITGILLDSKNRPSFYRRFYTRRALRILPPYYALLALLLLLHSASTPFVGLSFIYLANMTNFFGVACDYGPLWSLAVEEHFYIVWPMIVRATTRRRLAFLSMAIVIVVPALRVASFNRGGSTGWYTWLVVDGLATGSVLAVYLRGGCQRKSVRRLCRTLLISAVLMGVLGYPFGITTRERVLGAALQYTTVNVFFAGILLLFLLFGSSSRKGFVKSPILRFFGYISYGLYLDHLLVFRMYDRIGHRYVPALMPADGHFDLVLLRFALAVGVAIGVAYLSRRYFEGYFLGLKDHIVPGVPSQANALRPDQNSSSGVEAA